MTALILSDALREQIAREARAAFPRECCGLMEGVCEDNVMRVTALHPAHNLSQEADRFEIDPADHFRALRAARTNGCDVIGCYHSHPNGRAQPSERDGDSETGFLWLIAAVAGADVSLSVFRRGGGWQTLEMAPESAGKAA